MNKHTKQVGILLLFSLLTYGLPSSASLDKIEMLKTNMPISRGAYKAHEMLGHLSMADEAIDLNITSAALEHLKKILKLVLNS